LWNREARVSEEARAHHGRREGELELEPEAGGAACGTKRKRRRRLGFRDGGLPGDYIVVRACVVF
jgi:hypothetical protein